MNNDMPRRYTLFLLPLFVGAAALGGCHREQPAQNPPLEGAAIGGPFALTDQNGARFTQANVAGRYRIMYFGYTFCPDVCPVDVQNIAAAMKLLEKEDAKLAAQIVPIFVSVDPARDTPAVLKQFTSAFSPKLIGLTGTPQEIARVAKEYGIYYKRGAGTADGYLMDHSRQIYLFDRNGKPLALLPESPPAAIVAEIKRWAHA